jgi:hypothetical protein
MDFIPKKKDKEGSLGCASILPLDRVGLLYRGANVLFRTRGEMG